jgi:hypothetical protein
VAGTIQKVWKIEENAKCRKGKSGIYFNFMEQILLEKLVILQLIEIFFTLYGTQKVHRCIHRTLPPYLFLS